MNEVSPDMSTINVESPEDAESKSIVWWLVTFTCVYQTLHSLSLQAIQWLLLFLATLLSVFGQFSSKIQKISQAFPSTLYLRKQYLKDVLSLPTITYFVVCPSCHSLHHYSDCVKTISGHTEIQSCPECLKVHKNYPLLKRVLTSHDNEKFYPHRVYPYMSIISALQSLLMRPNFLQNCMQWKLSNNGMYDVYDGRVWNEYFVSNDSPFHNDKHTLGLTMNIDWFQPFKHRTYSVGVIYVAIMNLPRHMRFKRVIVGLISGSSEPPIHI